jgi:hypothetical protein
MFLLLLFFFSSVFSAAAVVGGCRLFSGQSIVGLLICVRVRARACVLACVRACGRVCLFACVAVLGASRSPIPNAERSIAFSVAAQWQGIPRLRKHVVEAQLLSGFRPQPLTMSNASLTAINKSQSSKITASPAAASKVNVRGSMATVRQQPRGGRRPAPGASGGGSNTRKSRISYGSRSRFNANNSSQNSSKVNHHKIIVDGVDVTPLSLLPPNATPDGHDGAVTSATTAATSTTVPATTAVKSSLLQRQQPDLVAAQSGKGLTVHGAGSASQPLTAAQLDEDVVITLTETDTMELFHLRGYVVHQESDQQRVVAAQNEAYKALFERRDNKDLFSCAAAQTTNLSSKHKKVQAEPPLTREVEVTATNWDIFDSQVGRNELEDWQPAAKDKDGARGGRPGHRHNVPGHAGQPA